MTSGWPHSLWCDVHRLYSHPADAGQRHTRVMLAPLIEFPADDPARACRFWKGVLGADLAPRPAGAGAGWEIEHDGLRLGVDT